MDERDTTTTTATASQIKSSVLSPSSAPLNTDSQVKTTLDIPHEPPKHHDQNQEDDQGKERKKSSYARTFDGTVFKIPETHNMISSLFDPRLPKSHLDLITLSTLIIQIIPLFIFPRRKLKSIYLIWFLFWRLTYNLGLGWTLKKQSENKFLIKLANHFNLFNSKLNPKLSNWIENQLKFKMSTNNLNYDLNQFPIEFNVWLLFRQVVDIILLNDFLSYFCLSYCSLKLPNHQPSTQADQPNLSRFIIRSSIGVLLVGFNIWVKLDAHRIVHDFAWYWGDAFFLSLQDLVFDGVFEMAPHPMYSIGYAGFYGASLIAGSRVVFFVSLFAHLCQFGFLVYFENPHIQRTYGPQARPLTAPRSRSPLRSRPISKKNHLLQHSNFNPAGEQNLKSPSIDTHQNHHDTSFQESKNQEEQPIKQPIDPIEIREQLEHKLFSRKDMILISNFDKFKSIDFATVLVIGYNLLILLIRDEQIVGQKKGGRTGLIISCINAIGWRIWFSFGLGFRLKQQSANKMMVRHFLTKYYYPIRNYRYTQQQKIAGSEINHNDEDDLMDELKFEVIEECFHNWKGIYNLSLMMTYVSFALMSIKFYKLQDQWDISAELIRITFGLCLVGIHIWTAFSAYEVLGKFGWFYGDFFADDYPVELTYGGIYRYLNNPERSMGGAGFIGMSLMSGNKFVFALALCSMLCHWWFLSSVEIPHMKKVYGGRIRKEAGLTKVLKQNARKLKSRTKTSDMRLDRDSGGVSLGGRSEEKGDGKGFEQRFKEVQGTFEFIYDETVQALDEFLEKSAPRLSGVVRDTKVLLQSSGQRLILTRVTNDLSSYDTTQYRLSMKESTFHPARDPKTNRLRFHMGEPIRLEWSSPWNHSRADWIGCYKRGSNKSGLVTEVASSGRWCGLFEDEWEGDIHIGENRDDHVTSELNEKNQINPHEQQQLEKKPKNGALIFKGDRLPWEEGIYEFRFHHDGKYNVMAITEPFEIYVERIGQDVENMKEVEDNLRKLVGYGLGMDTTLIPKKLKKEINVELIVKYQDKSEMKKNERDNNMREAPSNFEGTDDGQGEEDRFTVMSLEEARRIQRLIGIGIGVELGIEIIIEDCEICKLAKRIVFVKSLLKPFLHK